IRTIAGTGAAPNSIDGPGGDPTDDRMDGIPAINSALTPIKGVLDHANKILYFSDLSSGGSGGPSFLRSIDLTSGTINTLLPFNDIPYALAQNSAGDLYFSTPCQVNKYSFSTGLVSAVAGTGVCGFSGDGQLATQAQISPLNGQVIFDGFDNLFIADSQNARIRRIDSITGIISTVAGDGTATQPVSGSLPTLTGFGGATGIAFDSQGYLLIVNQFQLMRVSPGANGIVDGGNDEVLTVIGGCSSNCQSLPFGGDGGPITQPVGINGDFLSVASDG